MLGRKRQVMKLLMDKLYLKAAGPDLYVTHDLKYSETVSEIRTRLTISVRSATKFLQRITEHERNVKNEPTIEVEVEPDPEDPTKSKLYLFSTTFSQFWVPMQTCLGTFFRPNEAWRSKGIEWKKPPSKGGSTSKKE